MRCKLGVFEKRLEANLAAVFMLSEAFCECRSPRHYHGAVLTDRTVKDIRTVSLDLN